MKKKKKNLPSLLSVYTRIPFSSSWDASSFSAHSSGKKHSPGTATARSRAVISSGVCLQGKS